MNRPVILVVEDNPITRKMVRVALTAEHYSVLEAPDGQSAVDLAARHGIDLILQDLKLPDMDGFELVKRFRELPGYQAVPILAVSGFISRLDEARAGAIGFTDFLVKPIAPSELTRLIATYLARIAVDRGSAPGLGRRILLADDDEIQRPLARLRLSEAGFQVALAADGAEALALARSHPPDAIVSDALMPELDGFGLCLAVRGDPALAHVPVVLTGNTYLDPGDLELGRSMGANAFVLRTPDYRGVVEAVLAAFETPSPPATAGDPGLRDKHVHRMIVQLERQAAMNAGLSQRCAAQASALSILRTIADALSEGLGADGVLEDILSQSLEAGGLSMGALYVLTDGGELAVRARSGSAQVAAGELESFFGHEALFRLAMDKGVPVTIPSAAVPEEVGREFLGRAGPTCAVIVPIDFRGARAGALLIGADANSLMPDELIDFTRTLGRQIAHTIALHDAFSRTATANVALEERVRERTAALEAAQQALVRQERLAILGQVAGSISHELRNPLGVIKNSVYYLGLVLPQEARLQKHLHILEREVGTASRIIGGLLDFTRVRPPNPAHVDLHVLAGEELTATPAPEAVTVLTRSAPDLPVVFVDAEQIRVVLGNIIVNAVQAMPEGGTLVIETARAGTHVALSVSDTGCGIEAEHLPRIFEPLFTTKARGIGLGLSLARRLVDVNGGTLDVHSAPARGTTFTMRFPAA